MALTANTEFVWGVFFYRIWAIYSNQVFDLSDYIYTEQFFSAAGVQSEYSFLDSDIVAVFQQQAGQDQAQAHAAVATPMMAAHYPAAMYNIQMGNMPHGHVPQYAWPVNMRPGMPATNMMQQHPQQMQMGAGKTMPGS